MLDTLLQDVRFGLRVLVRERAFCALAVLVLALGICGVGTMFSVVNGAVLRGFSFPNTERLVSVNFIDPSRTTPFGVAGQVSAADFEEVLPEQKSFEMMAAYLNGSTVNITIDGTPRRHTGAYTTENFLRILGVAPVLGRDLLPADNKPGAEKVALISHALWQREFGGAPDVVGKAVSINGSPATICGVMPPGFHFPVNEDLWIPLYSEFPVRARNDPRAISPGVVALLRPGVSLDQANAEFDAFAKRLAAAYPDTNKAYAVAQVEPLTKTYTPAVLAGMLWTMLAFCVGVLLIACVNVMNMQFARATLRARELAVRSSLGATRGRLLRQMLTESLLVAGIGATVGVFLAWLSIDWLQATVRALDNPPPSWISFDLDTPVLAFTVAATLLAAVASGLLPAWMASRANTVEVLREGGRGHTGRTVALVTRGLVVLQILVTCVLLIGSLLQARSILKQQAIDYGYDTGAMLSARMGLMDGAYPTQEARRQFYDRLQRELKAVLALPEVRERMVAQGQTPVGNTPEEFVANLRADLPKWEALIKASGAKLE